LRRKGGRRIKFGRDDSQNNEKEKGGKKLGTKKRRQKGGKKHRWGKTISILRREKRKSCNECVFAEKKLERKGRPTSG